MVASLGGALFAVNAGYVSPDILSFGKAGDSLIAALIGGFGLLGGPVLGTFLFVLRPGQAQLRRQPAPLHGHRR